ncbi:hypothetical protein LPJ56_000758 [Coemansia sp. RSA 2599]|nr:hypothetical protein LPJ75_000244 [Coemansia sp. RSA 2598]KAJ1828936.1 hypothetical protein LPJ56_000758 [Coemansia sp. RSA 2599]
MVSKRLLSTLTLSALAAANVLPLHPRAEATPAITDIGFVLNNVADILPNESMINELHEAATSLMQAAGQSGHDKKADEFLSSYLSSLDANNDPAYASQWASDIVSLLQSGKDIPDKVAEPYSSIISVLQDSKIKDNSSAIVSELIKFVTAVRSLMPEMFVDELGTETGTSSSGTDSVQSSIDSSDSGSKTTVDASDSDSKASVDASSDEAGSEEGDLSSDGSAEETESESESSGAPSNGRLALGLLSATGIAISVMTSLF